MKKRLTASDYARFHRITAIAWSPEKAAAFAETTVEAGGDKSRIWVTEAGKEACCWGEGASPAWSPDGLTLAYLASVDGVNQIVLAAAGAAPRPLTTLRHGVTRFCWAPDGTRIAFEAAVWPQEEPFAPMSALAYAAWQAAQKAAPRVSEAIACKHDEAHGMLPCSLAQIGVVSLADGAQRLISPAHIRSQHPVWSPDGTKLAWYAYDQSGPTAFRAAVYVADAAGENAHSVSGEDVLLAEADICFSADSESVIYSAFDVSEGEVELLYRVSAAGGEKVCLFQCGDEITHGVNCIPAGRTFAHVENSYLAAADGFIYFLCGWHGHNGLFRISEAGGKPEAVYEAADSLSAFCAPAAGEILCVKGDFREPGDLYLLCGGKKTRLTRRNAWLSDYELADAEETWVGSRDGKEKIQTWLVRPLGFEKEQRYPTVLYVRGGPDCTWVTDFWHELQVLAAAGMAVVYCNPRGSMGYGRAFAKSDYAWGQEALEDLLGALDYAVEAGVADPERLGVTGGSYGGYMTNKLVGESDRFRAAVSQRPLVNTATSYGTGDMGFASQGKTEEEIAAITMKEYIGNRVRGGLMGYVEKITVPMLFLHAFCDYRCSYEQSEQMFTALREKHPDLPLRLVMLPDDNHGVARDGRPVNLIRHVEEMTRWFRRYLGGEAPEPLSDADGIVSADAPGPQKGVREKMWQRREGMDGAWPAGMAEISVKSADGLRELAVHCLPAAGERRVLCLCERERVWIPALTALQKAGISVISLEADADAKRAAADALTALDAIAKDGQTPGLIGFGCGGTAALWLAEFTNRFAACAVYGATPSRLIAYASSDMPGGSGEYEVFRDFMWASLLDSPVCYAEKARIPMLVMTGECDLLAPPEGAHQLFVALKDTHPQIRTRLVTFPGTGHEPPSSREALQTELIAWFAAPAV